MTTTDRFTETLHSYRGDKLAATISVDPDDFAQDDVRLTWTDYVASEWTEYHSLESALLRLAVLVTIDRGERDAFVTISADQFRVDAHAFIDAQLLDQ